MNNARTLLVLAGVALVVLAPVAHADTCFTVHLNGNQITPPVNTSATGTGFFILSDDHLFVQYQVSYSNLSSAVLGSHVHRFGNLPTSPPIIDIGDRNPAVGIWQFPTPQMIDDLFAGKLYVNVHTANFHLGEIQGTILPLTTPIESATWSRIKALYRRQ